METVYTTAAWPPPESASHKDVEKLCEITWSKKIAVSSLPRYTGPTGKVFGKLNFVIEMTCAGSSVDFTVIYDGKQVGAQNVSVIFKTEDNN